MSSARPTSSAQANVLRISVERWIFTAAHELGHIVLHQDTFDISQESEDEVEEMEANWFASALLMPNELFDHEWELVHGHSGDD